MIDDEHGNGEDDLDVNGEEEISIQEGIKNFLFVHMLDS